MVSAVDLMMNLYFSIPRLSFYVSGRQQNPIRSSAAGASSTFSEWRAMATIFSMLRADPSRMMGMGVSWGKTCEV